MTPLKAFNAIDEMFLLAFVNKFFLEFFNSLLLYMKIVHDKS